MPKFEYCGSCGGQGDAGGVPCEKCKGTGFVEVKEEPKPKGK